MSETELERLHQQVLILQRRNDSLQADVENMDRALRALRYDRDLALDRVSEQAGMLRKLENENAHLRKLLGLRDKEVLFDEEEK